MIGPSSESFAFDHDTVFLRAPEESGVYALLKGQAWVYVGESGNIQERLFDHLRPDENACITRNAPDFFQFESCPAAKRVDRQDELIRALNPLCNMKMG